MTDADKIRHYDWIVELLKDRVALELHYRKKGMTGWTVQQVRTDVYEKLVEYVLGTDMLDAIRA